MSTRSGIGFDSHRLVAGRPLILGGVHIPSEVGLSGHSDADVLAHAVIDALLGAAALDDIGAHFPDTDAAHRGADSLVLLGHVVELLGEHRLSVIHVDATVVLERPRIAPHRHDIRCALAGALRMPLEAVSVKATTGEGLGFVGRGEGAAALAVATVTALGGAS